MPRTRTAANTDHYTLVVLSDLHYGDGHFFRQPGGPTSLRDLGGAVADVLHRENVARVDCLIFAGDFFGTDTGTDFGLAAQALPQLIDALSPSAVVAVPGNHDLSWAAPGNSKPLIYYDLLMENNGLEDFVSTRLPAVRVLSDRSCRPVALLLLDSCRVEGRIMAGVGYFGDDQIASAEAALNASGVSSDSHTVIAVAHHHVLPVWPRESLPPTVDPRQGPPPTISYTIDGIELLRKLVELGAVAVLHGHNHRPGLVHYTNQLWSERGIEIVANGSCALKAVVRQFFVVEARTEGITVRSYWTHRDNEALFELDPRWPPVEVALERRTDSG